MAQPRFSTKSSVQGPRAMDVLDEAVSLLRQAPLATTSIYYLGALPYCLALIYFYFDMTQSATAEAHLPGEAMVLTGLYFWMKTCQAVFGRKLLAWLEGGDEEEWSPDRWINTALIQIIYAGSLVLVYPIALLVALPFGWVNAFYHNISVLGTGAKSTVRSSFKEAEEMARLWPRQNHLILGILLLGSFVLFLNLAVFLALIPNLLHMFFGIETVFADNQMAWNNSSFYLDVAIFCFLVLNPLNKAVYALRCFYGRARMSGADLKAELRQFERAKSAAVPVRVAALIVLFALLPAGPAPANAPATAAAPPATTTAASTPAAATLDQAIQKTLQKDEFSWRMPRAETSTTEDGFMARLIRDVLNYVDHIFEKMGKMLGKFFKWLFDHRDRNSESGNSALRILAGVPWKLLIILFAVVLAMGLVYWLAKLWRQRNILPMNVLSAATVRTVDLEAEDVPADALPEDSWLTLAQQLIDRGELRLALRAFYLATLSMLAQNQLVRLAPAKSNRDYLVELTRRLRGRVPAVGFFQDNVRLFEASWYGTHDVTSSVIDAMRTNHQQVRTHVTA
jgi:flagellar biosynthesis protein FlhB